MDIIETKGGDFTYKYLMTKKKDWLANTILEYTKIINKLKKKIKIQENIVDEDTLIIEIKDHKKVSSLTSFNKYKRIIYINGQPVGNINKTDKKWEARLMKGKNCKRPKTKLEAVLDVIKMYLGDIK